MPIMMQLKVQLTARKSGHPPVEITKSTTGIDIKTPAATGNEPQPTTSGNETQAILKRKRGPRPKQPKKDEQRMVDKILKALQNGSGEPAIYASTTKGGMKLIYEGHHFRFTFRRGQYSIFQCCFKENMQECKVRVVCDQKRVYPLDGDHIHFMQATDKSVTSMIFEPDDDMDEVLDNMPSTQGQQKPEFAAENNESDEYEAEQNEGDTTVDDVDDFREKIKRRLQKALLGKNK